MDDLLEFFQQEHDVPSFVTRILQHHIDLEHFLVSARAPHLLWLAEICVRDVAGGVLPESRMRVFLAKARTAYENAQAGTLDHDLANLEAASSAADRDLRGALKRTMGWSLLLTRWGFWISRGLPIVWYMLRAETSCVRVLGTQVGQMAVRQIPWEDLEGLRLPRHHGSPRWAFLVDHIDLGKSAGSFASAAVAFEIADRLDRQFRRGLFLTETGRYVLSEPTSRALRRYSGALPWLSLRSTPARPPASFLRCRNERHHA